MPPVASRSVAQGVLGLLTAISALVSPLLSFYTLGFLAQDTPDGEQSVSGWGGSYTSPAGVVSDVAPIRFGVVLTVTALLLLVGSALLLSGSRRWGQATLLAGAAATAAAVATAFLDYFRYRSTIAADTDPSYRQIVQLDAGGWLLLLTGVLALATVALALAQTVRTDARPALTGQPLVPWGGPPVPGAQPWGPRPPAMSPPPWQQPRQ